MFRAFALALFILLPAKLFCSDSTVVKVPDGTDGSIMDVNKNDSNLATSKWYDFENNYTSLKFGGGMLVDFASFIQDDASKEQNRLVPSVFIRDFRFLLSGKIKSKRFITWKTGIMYDGNKGSWFVRETGVTVGVPELSGYIFVGRTKEGMSLSKVMNGYAGWTVERQMAVDMIPILADGIKWMGYVPKLGLFWNAGVYTDLISYKQSFSTYSGQAVLRCGWMPFYNQKKNALFHLGVNYRYGIPENGQIQVRSKPEVNSFPYFVDSKTFKADHSNMVGYEVYFSWGSILLGSEGYMNKFSSAESDNPAFKGGAVFATYIFTGQAHPYSTVSNIYGFVPVDNSVFAGGAGALELVVQYSTLNLNGGNIAGGKFWRITPMVNWYLSDNIRLEFVYGYGILDRYNLKGATQFFQNRVMFIF